MSAPPNPDKPRISLSIGDPTVFGNFACPEHFHDELRRVSVELKSNGYQPAVGDLKAREAIAAARSVGGAPLTAADIILASGCSHAIEMCFGTLCNGSHQLDPSRSNVLLPNPGFSLYKTLCDAKGIAIKTYDLLPEKNWEADPAQIESLIDEHTACILINNPSNPCGSVFSRAFLEQILAVAERNFVPIIADEIYEYMAFEEGAYIPLASLTTEVPILQVSGLSKRYMAPGWRIGWVAIHDRHGRFEHVRSGLYDYATMILGPNALLQACIPSLMNDTPAAYYERNLRLLHDNAKYCQKRALQIKGLKPVTPQGAMYTMVGIDRSILKIENDVEFCRLLFTEESVHLLPGSCFGSGGVDFFRVVICPPIEQLEVAWDRIAQFCERYAIAH